MRIVLNKPITVINAGPKRTSSLILPSDMLKPVAGSEMRHSTGEVRLPKMLEHLLMMPDLSSKISHFLDPETYCPSDQEECLTLPPGPYELVPVDNPYRLEQPHCHEPWFAIAGTNVRAGMPLACWAEHIVRGSAELLHG